MTNSFLRNTPNLIVLSFFIMSNTGHSTVLEEVYVTATQRSESLQDIPVSVNVYTNDKITQSDIGKIADLQSFVPNLSMSETGVGTNIYIRGIGSGINPGFEQSVGMYFDGISYGRAQLARAPFLDLARIEVLRGPQNILFGKNSIAGAINLHSARPTQETESLVSASYETDIEEVTTDLVFSGSLTDSISSRIALRARDSNGYFENLTNSKNEPHRKERTARLGFSWEVDENISAYLKLESGSFDVLGRNIEIINDQPAKPTIPRDRNNDGVNDSSPSIATGRKYSEIINYTEIGPGGALGTINEHPSVLNTSQDFKRSSNGDFSNNKTKNVTLEISTWLGENSLTSVTGYLNYRFNELCDCDFTGARMFSVYSDEEYSQFSQEFRVISPTSDSLEWISGLFFQQSSLAFDESFVIDSDILPDLINAADLLEGGARGDSPADGDAIGGFTPAGGVGDAGDHVRNLYSERRFTTDSKLYSAFFQATWHLTDISRLTAGARYSVERKKSIRRLTFMNSYDSTDNHELKTVLAKNFVAEEHHLAGSRKESNLSPSLILEYDLDDLTMAYASISIGNKSGGFDARSNGSPESNDPAPHNLNYNTPIIGAFEYDEEKAKSLEIGIKKVLANSTADFQLALFLTDYDDLQVSIFDGSVGFNVGNAGSAQTQGIEFDSRLALSDSLTASFSIALLDFEFTEFRHGQCYQDQEDPEIDGLCDYTGKTNQYVADYSGSFGLKKAWNVGSTLILENTLDIVFSGEYNPTQNLDPDILQPSYYKANIGVSLGGYSGIWRLELLAKNITNEATITYANDTPLSNSTFGSKGHYGFISQPRSFNLAATYTW